MVWPFETGLRTPEARAVIAEVYPSLLRDEVRARRREGEILDSAQVRVNADAFARLDAGGGLAPLFAGAPCLTPDRSAGSWRRRKPGSSASATKRRSRARSRRPGFVPRVDGARLWEILRAQRSVPRVVRPSIYW